MSDERRFAYQFMYLGAFAAFAIEQAEHAHTLAELTTSDEECIHVVLVMRAAPEGQRVQAALEYLQLDRTQPVQVPLMVRR